MSGTFIAGVGKNHETDSGLGGFRRLSQMTRVAVVQVNPLLGAVPQNIARCLALAGKEKADIYVFPELVTTGYNFSSLKQLEGLAEPANRGMAFNAFSRFAVERKCYVCYGFAEASKAGIYNSASLIGPKKNDRHLSENASF